MKIDTVEVIVEGAGPKAIVMIHGWPDTHRLWDGQVASLKDHYRCVRFTLPGFDLSQPKRAYSLDEVVETIHRVVAEACAFSLPVVTTTAVPWPELEENGCGFRSAPNTGALATVLESAMRLSDATRLEMGERARKLVNAKFRWALIAEQFIGLYGDVRPNQLTGTR